MVGFMDQGFNKISGVGANNNLVAIGPVGESQAFGGDAGGLSAIRRIADADSISFGQGSLQQICRFWHLLNL